MYNEIGGHIQHIYIYTYPSIISIWYMEHKPLWKHHWLRWGVHLGPIWASPAGRHSSRCREPSREATVRGDGIIRSLTLSKLSNGSVWARPATAASDLRQKETHMVYEPFFVYIESCRHSALLSATYRRPSRHKIPAKAELTGSDWLRLAHGLGNLLVSHRRRTLHFNVYVCARCRPSRQPLARATTNS